MSEYEYEDEIFEEVEEVTQVAPKKKNKKKYTYTDENLKKARDNLAKGRDIRMASLKAKKNAAIVQQKKDESYDNYYVNDKGVSQEYEYEDSDDEYEYVYEDGAPAPAPKAKAPKAPKAPKAARASKAVPRDDEPKLSKKEMAMMVKIEKQEELLNRILEAQQGAQQRRVVKRKPKQVRPPRPVQTIQVQIPKQAQTIVKEKEDPSMKYLMSLFN